MGPPTVLELRNLKFAYAAEITDPEQTDQVRATSTVAKEGKALLVPLKTKSTIIYLPKQ